VHAPVSGRRRSEPDILMHVPLGMAEEVAVPRLPDSKQVPRLLVADEIPKPPAGPGPSR
jgi:hypothetical protein